MAQLEAEGDPPSAEKGESIQRLAEENVQLRREIDELRERLGHMERLADQDPLAPIPNRRAFVRELNRVIAFTQRYKARSSLVFFDINGFKRINDSYGHAAGDKALLHVAQVLLKGVRESDIVGRLGGDEFGVILVLTDARLADEKARQLAQSIEKHPFLFSGMQHRLSVAYGVTTFSGGESVSDVLAAADRAMYLHKAELKDLGQGAAETASAGTD